MRYFLILLISFYQRFISPCKGFRCAYGRYHHRSSCSGQVKQILTEHGVIAGWPLIRLQFQQCRQAYNALAAASDVAECYRTDRHRLLRPVRWSESTYLKSMSRAKIYLYLPVGAQVAGPREMGYVCCFII